MSQVVCSVRLCVLGIRVSCAKTVELIEMLFGKQTCVGPSNHLLDGDPDPPLEGALLRGHMPAIVTYLCMSALFTCCCSYVQN